MTNTKRKTPLRRQANEKRAQRKAADYVDNMTDKVPELWETEDKAQDDQRKEAFTKLATMKQFFKMKPVKSDKTVARNGVKLYM